MKFCPNCANRLAERMIESHLRPYCERCGFIHYEGPKVAVGVIISRDGEILLNRRDIDPGRGRWSFPSGYVDAGEELTEAARREVREETGLDVEIGPLIGVYDNPKRPVVFIVYLAAEVKGEARAGQEVQEVVYFSPDELPDMAFDHDEEIIFDWLECRSYDSKGSTDICKTAD